VKKFLEAFGDEQTLIVCVDEVGFGSRNQNIRRYGKGFSYLF
jgi:hypothetical protein